MSMERGWRETALWWEAAEQVQRQVWPSCYFLLSLSASLSPPAPCEDTYVCCDICLESSPKVCLCAALHLSCCCGHEPCLSSYANEPSIYHIRHDNVVTDGSTARALRALPSQGAQGCVTMLHTRGFPWWRCPALAPLAPEAQHLGRQHPRDGGKGRRGAGGRGWSSGIVRAQDKMHGRGKRGMARRDGIY